MINYSFPYWGPFVLETNVEQELVDILLEKGNESREKNLDNRKNLAGQIDNEYYYEDYEWFIPKFAPYMGAYLEGLTSWAVGGRSSTLFPKGFPENWNLDSIWINYQKAKEYNPPHHHSGDISFVVYLQVPEELIKEHEEKKDEHRNEGPGVICFQYGEQLPFSVSRYSRIPKVGKLIIFPGWLQHYVHGFTSDVERISVSGNIRFLYDKI